MNTINKEAVRLTKSIYNAQIKLGKLQNTCDHINSVGEYKSNTGNWCSQDDSYWIEISCKDCLRKYRVYNDTPEYRNFKGERLVK